MIRRILIAALMILPLAGTAAERDSLKVAFLGDSYTTFEGHCMPATNAIWYREGGNRQDNDVTKVEETWWYQVVEMIGGKLEINNSYSGSTISCRGYRGGDYSDRAFVTRIYNLGDPDLILICGGTNDSWAGVAAGEYKYEGITAKDLYTFRPAMSFMLREIKVLYPEARVIFVLNSELRQDINDSVHTICTHYDVECVDLHDIDKGSGHPSVAGMKAFAEQVVEQINKAGNKLAE